MIFETLQLKIKHRLERYPAIYRPVKKIHQNIYNYKDNFSNKYKYIIGASVLLRPLVIKGKFYKGVLFVKKADDLVAKFPDIKKYFILISTTGFDIKWAPSNKEDIHGLTLKSNTEEFRNKFPEKDYMVIRNSDFIDENDFYPIKTAKKYDVFFNSRIIPLKRHDLFIKILYYIRHKFGKKVKVLIVPNYPRSLEGYSFLNKLMLLFTIYKEKQHYRKIKNLYKKAIKDSLDIHFIEPLVLPEDLGKLRSLYNKSKMHILLSKAEGVSRAVKESILCNTPVIIIKNNPSSEVFINNQTGKAVEDELEDIAKEILDMLKNYKKYSPREWALKNSSRAKTCKLLWRKINSIQKYPGNNINDASKVRQKYAKNRDDYYNLNNYKGISFMRLPLVKKEIEIVRKKFKKFVN